LSRSARASSASARTRCARVRHLEPALAGSISITTCLLARRAALVDGDAGDLAAHLRGHARLGAREHLAGGLDAVEHALAGGALHHHRRLRGVGGGRLVTAGQRERRREGDPGARAHAVLLARRRGAAVSQPRIMASSDASSSPGSQT
jgi:hypothetical protein